MRDRVYLKYHKKRKLSNYLVLIFIIIILSLISTYYIIKYFSNAIKDNALVYGEAEVRKFITIIINSAVNEDDKKKINIDDLMDITKNNNDEIQLITYDSNNVLTILNNITDNIQKKLSLVEEGKIDSMDLPVYYDKDKLKKGVIYEIPVGLITNNIFLSNLGAKIPVRYKMIGDVVSNISTTVSSYGINNALVEVDVYVEVSMIVNLPFITERITISNKIPLSLKIIQGVVPNYYLGEFTTNSNTVKSN